MANSYYIFIKVDTSNEQAGSNPQAYERSSRRNFSRPDIIVIEIAPQKITSYTQGS